ncbi:MAG: hypothetical protein R3C61_04425 [Bacteroidia bacterium]
MPFRPEFKQSLSQKTHTSLRQTLFRGGIASLLVLAGIFIMRSPEATDPGENPERCMVAARPDAEEGTVTISFTLAGDRDMALQVLNSNKEEMMSRLFTPVPPHQEVTLNISGWPGGKYTARLYNHRQSVSNEFEINGPLVLSGR